MAKGFIELNDAAINLSLDGTLVGTSVGYAVLDKDQLMVGEAGQSQAKLLPRWTNNRFWDQLSTESISNATSSIRHHADLAFAHLEQLDSLLAADEIVIAVPAYFQRPQLALLLGMAKEAGMPVRSLVDIGLISIAEQPCHPTCLYLDINLQRITLSVIRTDGAIRLIETQTIAELGLATFWDRWASIVAEQFIQTSRFDPMHDAASEQSLFNQLPDWIRSNTSDRSLAFDLIVGDKTQSTHISRDQLLTACATTYPNIVQTIRRLLPNGEQASLFVSHRFDGFPELGASLNLIPGVDITYLTQTAAADSANKYWSKLVGDAETVSHITSLSISPNRPALKEGVKLASHLVVGQHAYRLTRQLAICNITDQGLEEVGGQTLCTISRRGQTLVIDVFQQGVSINGGHAALGQLSLNPGDELSINNRTAILVTEV